ncbi:MAG: Asp-tRNA(Asn)/Glu-tRNA(Gln) amidotransferase subunit GatC [Patescibacteria group bacterium]|jgi:aspartyl-tRNA(Asn)/glutamyl-tRNA(Gln) amidotransferase subunit C
MSLTREDVKRLADLARLNMPEEELARAEKELDAVLGYVDRLQKVQTENVEPHTMPARAEGWRTDADLSCDDLTRELILSNFPSRKGDLLSVPPVFDKPKG